MLYALPFREAGVTLAQIGRDFGIQVMTLSKWIRQAGIDDGKMPGTAARLGDSVT